MRLAGHLRATSLGDVLGILHRGQATGVLELVEERGAAAGRRHLVRMAGGLVYDVDTPVVVQRLGDILRREGFIGSGDARLLARRLLERPDLRVGELLVEEQVLRPEVVGAALRQQLRERLEAVFTVGEASLRFHVVGQGRTASRVGSPLSPHEFLHGRPRARGREQARSSSPESGSSRPLATAEQRRRQALSVLGLSEAADRRQVQRAFRQLAVRLHPDRHPQASPGELASLMQGFAQLTAAYHELVA